jgi:hypothetical protein
MNTTLPTDRHPVTLTWRTTAIDEYSRTCTVGELREAVNAERDRLGDAKHPDIAEDLHLLCERWLADNEQENIGTRVSFTRVIAQHTDISLPELPVHTVSISGPERHDGEKPYTYVLRAADLDQARTLALAIHCAQVELDLDPATGVPKTPDVIVVEGEWDTFTGAPPWPQDLPGRAWNDLRGNEGLLKRAHRMAGVR